MKSNIATVLIALSWLAAIPPTHLGPSPEWAETAFINTSDQI